MKLAFTFTESFYTHCYPLSTFASLDYILKGKTCVDYS
jgi:hypothetical protein